MAKQIIIEDKLDNITLMLAAIADANSDRGDGSGIYFQNFKTLQALNRMGLASKILDSYSQIIVNRETGISIAAHSSGITSPAVDEETFVDAIGEAETKEYEFIYDGSAWSYDGAVVALDTYGITYSGTAADGDTIVVHETAEAVTYDILGIDHDIPADPNLEHTITLCRHDCANYNALAYKKPQGLVYVDPTLYPNGLEAGTYVYVTLLNGANNASTDEDGSYGMTLPIDVPAGGLLRHTTIGLYSASGYSKSHVLGGKWAIYGTIETGRKILQQNIETTEASGSTGIFLGQVTAEDYSKRGADHLNMTRRNAYGANTYIGSDERKWMNSDAAQGTDSLGIYLWQSGSLGIFDTPASYNAAGNLRGMDPALLDVIGPVLKRTYVHAVDRTDQSVKYVDTEETIFPLSGCEVGIMTTNDGVYENAVSADGTPVTKAYDYYARRTADERIKTFGGTARIWWLRSPHAANCSSVRGVSAAGALSTNYANSTFGAVDAFCIV